VIRFPASLNPSKETSMSFRSTRSRLARKLAAYASAALAAGTGTDSTAAIVYTDFGPNGVVVPSGSFNLDFDLDGLTDFTIDELRSWRSSSSCFTSTFTTYSGTSTTRSCRFHGWHYDRLLQVVGMGQHGALGQAEYATNFNVGDRIAADAQNHPELILRRINSDSACGTFDPCTGPWQYSYGNFGNGFLGLTFQFGPGERNTGWAKIVVEDFEGGVKLLGFAYETEPGVTILAGDQGDLPNIPGDSNRDGIVDLSDLNNVRNNFGATGAPGSVRGDVFPFDGIVDLEDLNAVRNNLGTDNPVPEPPSLLLLAAGAAGLAALRSKRNRSEFEQN
jgi:hypothetical protein